MWFGGVCVGVVAAPATTTAVAVVVDDGDCRGSNRSSVIIAGSVVTDSVVAFARFKRVLSGWYTIGLLDYSTIWLLDYLASRGVGTHPPEVIDASAVHKSSTDGNAYMCADTDRCAQLRTIIAVDNLFSASQQHRAHNTHSVSQVGVPVLSNNPSRRGHARWNKCLKDGGVAHRPSQTGVKEVNLLLRPKGECRNVRRCDLCATGRYGNISRARQGKRARVHMCYVEKQHAKVSPPHSRCTVMASTANSDDLNRIRKMMQSW